MAKPLDIDPAIEQGIAFLRKNQQADGSFISYSSASRQPFRRVRTWQTTFVPALMLASLAGLREAPAKVVSGRLAAFLLGQRHDDASFNYWSKDAPEQRTQPYPNDLDDTFCALAALYLHNPAAVDGVVLARAVRLLLATEVSSGGPYRTWLVPADSSPIWLDVDIAVNSNIAYFLSLVSHPLPALEALMGKAILDDAFSSPYYPNECAFIYYFSRAYSGPHKNILLRKARQSHRQAGNDLDRALCLNARLRLGDTRDMAKEIGELLAGQRRDGSWPAAAFYADPVKNGKPYYNGCPALTTAFALEAIDRYRRASQPPSASKGTRRTDDPRAAVLALAERGCSDLPPESRAALVSQLRKLAASSNGSEITGLAQRFSQSLRRPPTAPAKDFFERLGAANLYGWLAYTAYDDFLDEEGTSALLPLANIAMRRSLDGFARALPDQPAFQAFTRQVFDTIDAANSWEQTHCRYVVENGKILVGARPEYSGLAPLAERSLGHTLAPLAVLWTAGHRPESRAFQNTRQALQHYLIAKQLNDDAHDWHEDLSRGHISYVVSCLLNDLAAKRGRHDIKLLLTEARPRFWQATLPAIMKEVRQHIRQSRRALASSRLFVEGDIISRLLDGMEASAKETVATQHQTIIFLDSYKQEAARP
jgi:hypothetical protein